MSTITTDLISHLQLGETVSANDAIYIKSADSKAYKFDVNDDTQVFAGIAKEAGVLNDYVRVAQTGRIKGFSGLTAGAFVYASTSAAGGFQLAEPADALKVILGIAKSATELVINGGLGIKPGGAGGAGGGLDIFYTEDFASTSASDLQVTGTITVADETVSPIAGAKSIKVTQVAGSLGAIVKSKAADLGLVLDINQKDNLISLKGRYKYDGLASEIDFVIYDETNAAELGRLSLVPSEAVKTFRLLANTIDTTATLSYYFEVAVENIGAVLEIDNVEGQVNPLPTAESVQKETVTYTGYTSRDGTGYIKNSTELVNTSSSLITIDNTTQTRYTFNAKCSIVAASSQNSATTGAVQYIVLFDSSNVEKLRMYTQAAGSKAAVPMVTDVEAGDYILFYSDLGSLDDINNSFSVTAQATSANVVFEGQTSELDTNSYTPLITGFGTPTNVEFTKRIVGDVWEIQGKFISGTPTAVEAQIGLPSGMTVKSGTTLRVVGSGFRDEAAANTSKEFSILATEGDAFVNVGILNYVQANNPITIQNGSNLITSGQIFTFYATIPVNELKASDLIFSVPVTNEVENKYNFRVSSTGVVSKDDRNIVSSAAWSPVGTLTVTVGTGVFSEAPHGLAIGTGTSNILAYDYTSSTATSLIFTNVNDAGAAADTNVSIELTKAGADYIDKKGYFLGNLSQPVAYLKDIKSSGTAGGTFTSGAWQSRVLNTLEGSNSWISIDTEGATKTTGTDGTARRFILEAGTYEIGAEAPARGVTGHQAKLYNITDAVDSSLGSAEEAPLTNAHSNKSRVVGEVKITSAKTFEIQHQCDVTALTTGFGASVAYGVDIIYTNLSIRKLK